MSDSDPPIEERKRPDAQREYRSDQIVVYWEPQLCIHTARCLRGLPQVFDINRRPWVKVEAASADQIAEVVMRCPTSALRFEHLDGGPQEQAPEQTTIQATPDGPLYVLGDLKIIDQDRSIRHLKRAALCRCGHSKNKPFCDGSHWDVDFRST
jgi:uncharacterized Fe-S cluster protein YjdI/CDGSH-type Zn-finger protein